MRRQAYYTCLAGGFHGYGHNDAWRVKPRWREALDDPGAQQMAILKRTLTDLPGWWTLVPDQTVFKSGGNPTGAGLNLGARSAAGKWVIAYIAGQPDVSVDLARITGGGPVTAKWINPADGSREVIGTYAVLKTRSFTRPPGWHDALLAVTTDISGADR